MPEELVPRLVIMDKRNTWRSRLNITKELVLDVLRGRKDLIRDDALIESLRGPHAPALFRALGPLLNMTEFYEAFDVAPNDRLYRAPDERVSIW